MVRARAPHRGCERRRADALADHTAVRRRRVAGGAVGRPARLRGPRDFAWNESGRLPVRGRRSTSHRRRDRRLVRDREGLEHVARPARDSRRADPVRPARLGGKAARRHCRRLEALACRGRRRRQVGRDRPPQRARAPPAHVRPDGRDRRGADDLAARAARRRPQLRLPLLLGPRHRLHARRPDQPRPARAGARVLRLAPGCDREDRA